MLASFLVIGFGLLFFGAAYLISPKATQEPEREVIHLTPYEYLVRQTYLRALQGDKASRDWVMNNVFQNKCVANAKKLKAMPNTTGAKSKSMPRTSRNVIDDVTMAMIAVGYKKSQAYSIISKIVENKRFRSAEELFVEATKCPK